MKKRLTLFLCTVVGVFLLCGCSGQKAAQDYNGYTEADLERACEETLSTLESLSTVEWQQYYSYYASAEGGKVYADMMEDWMEVRPQIGGFICFSDFEVSKAGKTLTATLTVDYTQRDIHLIYVFNANTMEVEAVNVEMIYTLGETMSKAALNTVMGIGVVFAILIIICLIISCFGVIPKLQKNFGKKQEAVKIVERPKAPEAAVPAADDLELVAVISAAIAAGTGVSTDDFVVRSIRRRK